MTALTDRLIQMYLANDGPATTAGYGTQAAPLDSFSVDGRTGNKTTNKDLPAWLKAIGMKGDAYAGGMLKPEIRYGFAYKKGQIHFADGTSFAAKKNKDGTYSYTGADGQAATYDPTDEQSAYNKKYQASTSNQSFLDKAKNTVGFENFGVKRLIQGIKDKPLTLFVDPARTPAGTKLYNTVTGDHLKPLTRQLGGHTEDAYGEYGRPAGFAKPLNTVAETIAGLYGGQALGAVGGKVVGAASNAASGTVSAGSAAEGTAAGNVLSAATDALQSRYGVKSDPSAAAANGAMASGSATSTTPVGNIFNTVNGAIGAGSGSGGANMPGGASTTSWTDWIGPAITAGSSLLGQRGANRATDAATRAANAEQARQFDQVRADTAPQRALGNAAVGRLAALNGYTSDTGTPDMSQFYTSPDYQFNLTEGQKAIDRSAAARGGLLGGAAVKEGIRYASGTASREYGSFVDRLMQQAGLGSNGTAQSAASGANAANNISANTMNAGNARASGYMDTAANVSNAANQGYSNYMLRRYLGG